MEENLGCLDKNILLSHVSQESVLDLLIEICKLMTDDELVTLVKFIDVKAASWVFTLGCKDYFDQESLKVKGQYPQ